MCLWCCYKFKSLCTALGKKLLFSLFVHVHMALRLPEGEEHEVSWEFGVTPDV